MLRFGLRVPYRARKKHTSKIRIGISHINLLIMKPIKVL